MTEAVGKASQYIYDAEGRRSWVTYADGSTGGTAYSYTGGTHSGGVPAGFELGCTGHANDGMGLVYMQQRYYEPLAGRFLSIDPVTTNASTGSLFNRYNHAFNKPYRFKDANGRFAIAGARIGAGNEAVAQWSVTGSVLDWEAVFGCFK